MESMRFLSLILITFTVLQCGEASFQLPFFGLNFGSSSINQDRTLTQSISRVIANSRSTASNYRSQANSINRQIDDISNRFFVNISSNVTDTIIEIHKPCEELLQRALNASASIADCASEQIDAIEAAINNTIATLIQCKVNKIEQGLAIVNSIFTTSGNASAIASNTIRGLANCIRNSSSSFLGFISPAVLSCKFNLAVTAGQAYTNLGIRLASLVVQAKTYLLSLKLDLAACGLLATAQAASSAATIASEIAACYTNSTSNG